MLAPYFEDGIHALKGRNTSSIRNYGLAGALTLAPLQRTGPTTFGRNALLGTRRLCQIRRRHAAVRTAARGRRTIWIAFQRRCRITDASLTVREDT